MESQELEIKVAIQVQKPTNIVFEAIINPSKMSNYFISESTGIMEEGTTVQWKFPEFDGQFPVEVIKIVPNEFVLFKWKVGEYKHLVEIKLAPYNETDTIVTIIEKGRENNEEGIQWLKGNTEGWANFGACLKAYLQFGINLRKGAFDFRFNQESI